MAVRRQIRVPQGRPTQIHLNSGEPEGGGKTWLVVLLLLLIVGGGLGTYVYLHYTGFRKEEPVEEEEAPKPKPKPPPKVEPVKEPEKPVEPAPPPPPPKKTVAELKAEADAAQKELDKRILAAREASAGHELPGFGSAKFGAVQKGAQIAIEQLKDGEGLSAGYGVSLLGPMLKTPFRSFGSRPIVWVTPKTYQIYKIEFSRDLAHPCEPLPDPDTTNLVADLEKKLHREAFYLDPEKYPLARREYVFPFGKSTMKVSEEGGGVQKLVIESEKMFDQVRAESEELRKEELAHKVKDSRLSSDKYPNSGQIKLNRIRLKKGTFRHFCGIAFGSLPPSGAKIERPAQGDCVFFIDYRKAKCRPFMNFEHGRAVIGRSNNAVVAVDLHSDEPSDGLTNEEYYAKVRKVLEDYYEVKPRETKGAEPMQTVVYGIGDNDLTFGPDPAGGFRLMAENTVLKALW